MEWKMEWNSECTKLQLTRVTGTTQSRLKRKGLASQDYSIVMEFSSWTKMAEICA